MTEGRRSSRGALGLLALLACGGPPGTSLVLEVSLGPGTAVPDELRVSARQRDRVLFEDQRLPRAGRLQPEAPPLLGTVLVELDSADGDVELEVLGLREQRLSSRGQTRAAAADGRQVRVPLVLLAEPDAPPLPPPQRICTRSCGPCQRCATATGGCEPVPAGAADPRPGGGCDGERACDGKGACRAASGRRCARSDDCASGFCVGGVCCRTACSGACRRCENGVCQAIVEAVDPHSCTDGRICDRRGSCRQANGRSCTSGRQCASGFCVDGICCQSACAGTCRRCDSGGVCTVVVGGSCRS